MDHRTWCWIILKVERCVCTELAALQRFRQSVSYYLMFASCTLDAVDHLANHGPYSEADAARLIREVASALTFLHGLNVGHGDLKPENRTSYAYQSDSGIFDNVGHSVLVFLFAFC